MADAKFTPGPWSIAGEKSERGEMRIVVRDEHGPWKHIAELCWSRDCADKRSGSTGLDDAQLIAAAPELYEALALHQEWCRRERSGPDYGAVERDSDEGRRISREWFYGNVDLCAEAERTTDAALAKARGEQ